MVATYIATHVLPMVILITHATQYLIKSFIGKHNIWVWYILLFENVLPRATSWMQWNQKIGVSRFTIQLMAIVSEYQLIYCEYMMVTGEYIPVMSARHVIGSNRVTILCALHHTHNEWHNWCISLTILVVSTCTPAHLSHTPIH